MTPWGWKRWLINCSRVACSYGEGVVLSRDAASFRDLMELIASLNRYQAVILQQVIGSRAGQDLRV